MRFISNRQIRSSLPKGPSVVPPYNPSGMPIADMVFILNGSNQEIETPETNYYAANNFAGESVTYLSPDLADVIMRVKNRGKGSFSFSLLDISVEPTQTTAIKNTTYRLGNTGSFSSSLPTTIPPNETLWIKTQVKPEELVGALPYRFNYTFSGSKNNTRIPLIVTNQRVTFQDLGA